MLNAFISPRVSVRLVELYGRHFLDGSHPWLASIRFDGQPDRPPIPSIRVQWGYVDYDHTFRKKLRLGVRHRWIDVLLVPD